MGIKERAWKDFDRPSTASAPFSISTTYSILIPTMSRVAPSSIVGKIVGPVGFGLMGTSFYPSVYDPTTDVVITGFTRPWAPIEYSVAIKVMKIALEQGANYWNGVRTIL